VKSITERLDLIGPVRFAILLILIPASLFYFAAGIYAASGLDPLQIMSGKHSLGDDFVTFLAAAHLALSGTPELAYDLETIVPLEHVIAGPYSEPTAWHYPPTFMLAMVPFALVPFPASLFLWLLVPLIALAWLVQRLFHTIAYSWLLPIFPSSVVCLVSGQNGFLNAFLIGFGLLKLEERPVLAGIAFGLLTWKPHLAFPVFIALAAGRHWTALGSACGTAVAMVVASVAVLGLAPWYAFFDNFAYVKDILDSGAMPWDRMPSVYVSARLLGFDVLGARALQILVALAAIATMAAIWYRSTDPNWRGAALVAALPLATPYLFDYDLVVLTFAVAWLLNGCLRDGWRLGDTAILLAVWIGPAVSWPLTERGGEPFLPLVFALLLAAICRRAFPKPAMASVPEPRTV
jgi:hypothetical protein